jgi:hypothetical protein
LKKQSGELQHDELKRIQNAEENKGNGPTILDNDSFNNNGQKKLQKQNKIYENHQ